jgi:hypothetical protein
MSDWLAREMELDWVGVEGEGEYPEYPETLEPSRTAPSFSESRMESGREFVGSGEKVWEAVRFMSGCSVRDARSSRADDVLGRWGRREEERWERVIEAALSAGHAGSVGGSQ